MNKEIVLKAYSGKVKGAVHVWPRLDTSTGKLLGVRSLSEEEKRNSPRVVDITTNRKITDGTTLNLNDPVDSIDWEWLRLSGAISEDFEEGLSDNTTHYVYEPDKELDDKIAKINLKYEAVEIIRNASDDQRKEMARVIFGQNVGGFRSKELYEYMMDRAEREPKKIIAGIEDPHYKEKLFLFALIDKKTISIDAHGHYRYGDIILGTHLDSAIHWMNDNRNRDLVGRFYVELNGKAPTATSSIINEFETLNPKKKKGVKDSAGKKENAGKAAEIVSVEEEL
jgi:hypothetical protein